MSSPRALDVTGRGAEVPPEPVAGPRFRAAAKLPVEGNKRRKLLCAIAAYEDAGYQPTIRELASRIGLSPRPIVVDDLLAALSRDGWLSVERVPHQRNRYHLRLGEGGGA